MGTTKNDIRVGLVTEFTKIGGGESNLYHLACELRNKAKVTVFCPYGSLFEMCQAQGIQTIAIRNLFSSKGWIKGFPLGILFPLAPSLFRDVNIIHCYSLHVLPKTFQSKVPIIWTNHGLWEHVQGIRGKVISHFVRKVVCVSRDTYDHARISAEKKTIIHLGCPLRRLNESATTCKTNARHKVITCVGRFQFIKGQDLLVKAMQLVATSMKSWSFEVRFIGDTTRNNHSDGRFKASVERTAASYVSQSNLTFRFLGFQTDPLLFIAESNFVVIPSRYESFSMVAIESLSIGKPVIAPNCGGPAEIINNRRIGICFSPGNLSSLAQAICEATENPQLFDTVSCVERSKAFSIERQADQLLELYKVTVGRTEPSQ